MQSLTSVPCPRQATSYVFNADELARGFFSCYADESRNSQVSIREIMLLTIDMMINNYYHDSWERLMDWTTLDACLSSVVDQALSDNTHDLTDDACSYIVHELFTFANFIKEKLEPHLAGSPNRRVLVEETGLCDTLFVVIL